MTSLADISLMGLQLEDALMESGGEITPAIQAMLEAVDLAERDKVDGYILAVRALEGDAEKWQKLEREFTAKRKTAEHRIEWLKENVRAYMAARQITHLPGDLWKGFKLVKGGQPPVEILIDPEDLPQEYTKTTVVANKEAIREALAAGRLDVGMARLGEPTLSLRIF